MKRTLIILATLAFSLTAPLAQADLKANTPTAKDIAPMNGQLSE